jgi:hypothetical protein
MVRGVEKFGERGKKLSEGIAKIKKILKNGNGSFKCYPKNDPNTV